MKTYIDKDERYPDYYLSEDSWYEYNRLVEVSDDFYAKYERIKREYAELQEELEQLYDTTKRGPVDGS
jgi:hypothetical protein